MISDCHMDKASYCLNAGFRSVVCVSSWSISNSILRCLGCLRLTLKHSEGKPDRLFGTTGKHHCYGCSGCIYHLRHLDHRWRFSEVTKMNLSLSLQINKRSSLENQHRSSRCQVFIECWCIWRVLSFKQVRISTHLESTSSQVAFGLLRWFQDISVSSAEDVRILNPILVYKQKFGSYNTMQGKRSFAIV